MNAYSLCSPRELSRSSNIPRYYEALLAMREAPARLFDEVRWVIVAPSAMENCKDPS